MSLDEYVKINKMILIPEVLKRGILLKDINEDKLWECVLDFDDLYESAKFSGVEGI